MSDLLDIPAADYHADPAPEPSLSHSVAVTLLTRSAYHAWCQHPRLGAQEREPSPVMEDGSAAHALLFGPAESVVAVQADSWRTNAAKEARDDARRSGKLPVLAARYDELMVQVGIARDAWGNCADLADYGPESGEAEKSLLWVDDGGAGPIYCRSRMDWISRDRRLVLDYKTSKGSAEPTAWQRQVFSLGYDLQDAFYKRGILTAFTVSASLVFLVQESEPPYAVSFVSLDPAAAAQAEIRRAEACRRWARCLREQRWPGYPDSVCYVSEPGYIAQQWAERLSLSPATVETWG